MNPEREALVERMERALDAQVKAVAVHDVARDARYAAWKAHDEENHDNTK